MKVGDLVSHKSSHDHAIAIVTGMVRNDPPDSPVYVTAVWMDWRGERSIEQQYLEVISESR